MITRALKGWGVALVCCCMILGTRGLSSAHAQTHGDVESGRKYFDQGVEYYRDGDLKAAAIEFKRAYEASPNYRVLFNLGQVHNQLLDYVEAQRYFQRYLSEGGEAIDNARKREVESALSKLSGRIAMVELTTNLDGAELFVDDVSVGHSPLREPLRVNTGSRRFSAALEGRPRVTRVVEAAGGETLEVQLEFPTQANTAALAADGGERGQDAVGPGPALWVGIGAGALAVGTGIMAVLAANDGSNYREALDRSTTKSEVDSLHDRAATKALVTDILLGATVVTAVVTVVLALRGGRPAESAPPPDTESAQLRVGAGSLGVAGQF